MLDKKVPLKGYLVPAGYKGYIDPVTGYILFPTEGEYLDFMRENEEEDNGDY